MKIGIMQADSNGCYPIPASKGGAVSTLVEHLIADNSINKQADLTIISYYDEQAELDSKKYKNVEFIWVKIPKLIKFFDAICFWCVTTFFPRKKAVSYKSIFSLLWYILFGINFLKKNKFDKLVLENNIPMAWMIKKSKYKGDYYYHLHNIPRTNARCEDVFKNCNGFLCVSKYVANKISSKNSAIGVVPRNKIHVLYNCVDTTQFQMCLSEVKLNKFREKYKINKDDKLAIFTGRLSKEKGIDLVIEAIKSVPDLKLLVVGSYMHNAKGSDSFQKKLFELAEDLKDRVIFTGYIDQSEIPTLYSLADVAVLPSIWEEPAGLTPIEALSCGISVITTKSGGIPEYVGKSAIILERDDNLIGNISTALKKIEKVQADRVTYIRDKFSMRGYMERFVKALS